MSEPLIGYEPKEPLKLQYSEGPHEAQAYLLRTCVESFERLCVVYAKIAAQNQQLDELITRLKQPRHKQP